MIIDSSNRGVQAGTYVGQPITVSLGVTSTLSAQLKPLTVYRIWSSVDSFFAQGDATVVATTTSHPLTAKLDTLIVVPRSLLFVAGIVSAGTGTLFISELDVLSA